MNVFSFKDYRDYLNYQIRENMGTRGYLSQLSKAAGCQLSYLSHVMSLKAELTPEHAAGMCTFWNLSDEESDFFVELVNLGRCGSPRLRKMIERRLKALRLKSEDISERLSKSKSLSEDFQSIYYSSWYWVAIHLSTSIHQYSTPQSISERLGLPLHFVQNTLSKLESFGLVAKENGRWKIMNLDLHLSRSSPFGQTNHLNWRQRAIQNIQSQDDSSIHYTSVQTMSFKDLEKMKELLLDFIPLSRKFGSEPPEEEMVCLSCDLFRV